MFILKLIPPWINSINAREADVVVFRERDFIRKGVSCLVFTDRFCEICGKELIDDDYCRIVFCGSVRKILCQEHLNEVVDLIDSWQRNKMTEYAANSRRASRIAFHKNSGEKEIFRDQ